jgi:hypothetical protein
MILEPVGGGTWLQVDGEVVPFEKILVEVHQALCNVLVP